MELYIHTMVLGSRKGHVLISTYALKYQQHSSGFGHTVNTLQLYYLCGMVVSCLRSHSFLLLLLQYHCTAAECTMICTYCGSTPLRSHCTPAQLGHGRLERKSWILWNSTKTVPYRERRMQ